MFYEKTEDAKTTTEQALSSSNRSQEKMDIIKTLLVAGSDLKRMQEACSFWEAKQTVIKGAVKNKRVDFSTLKYSVH